MTRVPVLAIVLLLGLAGGTGFLYLQTRPAAAPAPVQSTPPQSAPAQSAPAQSAPPTSTHVRLDRVAAAAKTTTSVKSFRFTFSTRFSGGSDSFTLAGAGAYDLQHRVVSMTTHVENAPPGSAAEHPMDVVADYSSGLVEYMRSAMFDGHIPAGKSWIRLDVGKYAKKAGIDVTQVMQSSSADPTQTLAMLRESAADGIVLGKEAVNGVSTTHYHAVIDLRRVVARTTDPEARLSVQRAVALTGTFYPIDVWIDQKGYLRRMVTSSYETSPDGSGMQVQATITEDLSDFGTAVAAPVPSGDGVVDAEDVPGLLG